METEKDLSKKIEEIKNLNLNASLQTKKGRYYAVISYTNEKGKSKPKWRALFLDAIPGNKKLAKSKIPDAINRFKEELIAQAKKEYRDNVLAISPEELQNEYENENSLLFDNTQSRLAKYQNMTFLEFLKESINEFSNHIEDSTLDSWKSVFNGRMSDYFRFIPDDERVSMMNPDVNRPIFYKHDPKLIEISQFDIEDYFQWLYDCGLKGSSMEKHYTIFNLTFARAVRKKIIDKINNPMADIKKPKIEPYIPEYYKPSELKKLFEIIRDNIIEVPVLFAGIYGLRKSEVLGLKWDAIDFEAGTFVIKHTVTKVKGKGENQIIQCKDLTKTKYGYRTYPLTPELIDALKRKKLSIEVNKRFVYKNKYVQQTKDYVCVKETGELIKPERLTKKFQELSTANGLKKIRLHDLRHSIGSLLASKNVNLRQIQDYLGHGSIKSTERYSHLQYESKENSVGVVENTIFS